MKTIILYFIFTTLTLLGCGSKSQLVATGESIDKQVIKDVVKKNDNKYQECYSEALEKNTRLRGTVELNWEYDDKGRPSRTEVSYNSTGDEDLGDCLAKTTKKIKFPPAPKGQVAKVNLPFNFGKEAKHKTRRE